MRKFGTVKITGRANDDGVLAQLLQLPRGTRIRTIRHDYDTDAFLFLVEGDWLAEVSEGDAAPEIEMRYNHFSGSITYTQGKP